MSWGKISYPDREVQLIEGENIIDRIAIPDDGEVTISADFFKGANNIFIVTKKKDEPEVTSL